MNISKKLSGKTLTIALTERLDTISAPQLQAELDASLTDVSELIFDFSKLDYLSSAGLRILLSANKKLAASNGTMSIIGVNSVIREVFEITGFSDIFTIR